MDRCRLCGGEYQRMLCVTKSRKDARYITIITCRKCAALMPEYLEDFPYEKTGQTYLQQWQLSG